jgi:hypothetical protein
LSLLRPADILKMSSPQLPQTTLGMECSSDFLYDVPLYLKISEFLAFF